MNRAHRKEIEKLTELAVTNINKAEETGKKIGEKGKDDERNRIIQKVSVSSFHGSAGVPSNDVATINIGYKSPSKRDSQVESLDSVENIIVR